MAVYGPALEDFKSPFLAELVCVCRQNPLPTFIGGDFNIMRNNKVKKIIIYLTIDGLFYLMQSLTALMLGKLT